MIADGIWLQSFQTSRVETSFARRWCKRHRSPTSHLQAENLRIHQYSVILWDAGRDILHPWEGQELFVGRHSVWAPSSSSISAGIRWILPWKMKIHQSSWPWVERWITVHFISVWLYNVYYIILYYMNTSLDSNRYALRIEGVKWWKVTNKTKLQLVVEPLSFPGHISIVKLLQHLQLVIKDLKSNCLKFAGSTSN